MKDGTFTYYTIQHRRVAESPWLNSSKLHRKNDEGWELSSWHYFGWVAHLPQVSVSKPLTVGAKADREVYEVWSATGGHGWWTEKYALDALPALRQADDKGAFDVRGPDGIARQCLRHEFRVVRITVSQKLDIIAHGTDCEDPRAPRITTRKVPIPSKA